MIASSREIPPPGRPDAGRGSFGAGDALGLAMGNGSVVGDEGVSTGSIVDDERRDDGEERVELGTHVRDSVRHLLTPNVHIRLHP